MKCNMDGKWTCYLAENGIPDEISHQDGLLVELICGGGKRVIARTSLGDYGDAVLGEAAKRYNAHDKLLDAIDSAANDDIGGGYQTILDFHASNKDMFTRKIKEPTCEK